jgi:HEPN domain-containing protein
LLGANTLRQLARARLADAEALHRARRYDGASYLAGYVVELALKARICRTLKWLGFPEKSSEFGGLQSFKTHDLDVLLRLSGREQYIKLNLFPEWTVVSQWNPEARYQPVGSASAQAVRQMLAAARKLLEKL